MQAKNLILPPILSRRPHHPKQHTPDEIKLISNMRRRNPHAGLVVFCVKLRQRVQVHVKFVPSACLVNSSVIGKHFFQYTAIDEYSRWRFVEAFEEHSTCSSALFVNHLVKAFPCPIECTQTDNGTEFTNLFSTHRDKTALFQVRFGSMVPYNIPQKSGKTAPFYRSSFSRFTYYIFYISTFTLSRCQISLTYSSIVRSEVNFPLFATFRIAERAHAVSLRYASSTFFCTSA